MWLSDIWGKVIGRSNFKDSEAQIILTPTSSNVAWINIAKENSNIWVICSKKTALENNLQIIESPFCPDNNETSFAVVSTLHWISPDDFSWIIEDKVMALLNLSDKPWILAQALKIISDTWLSLSFILSLPNNLGWYDFPLVIDKSSDLIHAQREIADMWGKLRVL